MSEQQETFSGSPPTSSHPAYNMDFIIDFFNTTFFDPTENTSQLPTSLENSSYELEDTPHHSSTLGNLSQSPVLSKNTTISSGSSSFIQLAETAKENMTSILDLSSSVDEQVLHLPLILLLMIVLLLVGVIIWCVGGCRATTKVPRITRGKRNKQLPLDWCKDNTGFL